MTDNNYLYTGSYSADVVAAAAISGTIYFGTNPEPLVTFHPDGTVDIRGDTYEAAKAFWDYVKQFAAAEYEKHVATANPPSPSPTSSPHTDKQQ